MIKRDDGHLRTRGKYRKHEPQASVFYIFSIVRVADNLGMQECQLQTCFKMYSLWNVQNQVNLQKIKNDS